MAVELQPNPAGPLVVAGCFLCMSPAVESISTAGHAGRVPGMKSMNQNACVFVGGHRPSCLTRTRCTPLSPCPCFILIAGFTGLSRAGTRRASSSCRRLSRSCQLAHAVQCSPPTPRATTGRVQRPAVHLTPAPCCCALTSLTSMACCAHAAACLRQVQRPGCHSLLLKPAQPPQLQHHKQLQQAPGAWRLSAARHWHTRGQLRMLMSAAGCRQTGSQGSRCRVVHGPPGSASAVLLPSWMMHPTHHPTHCPTSSLVRCVTLLMDVGRWIG